MAHSDDQPDDAADLVRPVVEGLKAMATIQREMRGALRDLQANSFTVAQLMARWSCSRRSIVDKIRAGELRAFRVGKRTFRISAAEVHRVESAVVSPQ